MIIFRYLYKEVMSSFLAVAIILLLVFVSSRFVRYLTDAATGRFSGEIVLSILWYRLPGFLELILPLALFLGVMLAYGRLYVDSEIVVLHNGGISKGRLLCYTLGPAFTVMLLTASLSLFFTPEGVKRFDEIWNDPKTYSGLGVLVPGHFKALNNGKGVIYIAELNQEKTQLRDVFIAQTGVNDSATSFSIIRAEAGEIKTLGINQRYIELSNGSMIDGDLDHLAYRFAYFDIFGQRVKEHDRRGDYRVASSAESTSTGVLFNQKEAKARANLQWRFALPFLVPIAAIIALALSETSHRRGRYLKILYPALCCMCCI